MRLVVLVKNTSSGRKPKCFMCTYTLSSLSSVSQVNMYKQKHRKVSRDPQGYIASKRPSQEMTGPLRYSCTLKQQSPSYGFLPYCFCWVEKPGTPWMEQIPSRLIADPGWVPVAGKGPCMWCQTLKHCSSAVGWGHSKAAATLRL